MDARAIPNFPEDMLSTAGSNLSGLAWHCYDSGSDTADPTRMTQLHNINPSMATYETECSSTSAPTNIIGCSTAAMALLSVQNWAKGVIMWNAALNASDGPVVAGGCSNCAPLVTINPTLNGSGQVTADSVTLDTYSRPNTETATVANLLKGARPQQPERVVLERRSSGCGEGEMKADRDRTAGLIE